MNTPQHAPAQGAIQGSASALPCVARTGGVAGFSGAAQALEQGAVVPKATLQSCRLLSRRRSPVSRQVRIRFQADHAKRLELLPPKEREQVVAVALGSALEGVALPELLESSQELQRLRLALLGLFEFNAADGLMLDVGQVDDTVARIGKILGGGNRV